MKQKQQFVGLMPETKQLLDQEFKKSGLKSRNKFIKKLLENGSASEELQRNKEYTEESQTTSNI